jgi:LPXTG-motif cell wall-anchored protein
MHYNFSQHNEWQNDCTRKNLTKLIEYGQLMSDRIQKLASDYINTYFDVVIDNDLKPFDYNACTNSVPVDYRWCSTQPGGKPYMANPGLGTNKYTLKPGITQIPALEFTVPVQNFIANGGNINIKDILSQATTVIKLFVPSSQGGSNNTVIDPNGNNPFDPNNNQGNNNQPGNTLANTGAMNIVNIFIGASLIGVAVYFANKKSKE